MKEDDKIRYDPKGVLYIGVALSICIISTAIYLYRKKFDGTFSNDTAIWGQFGDFLNVFISIANLIVVTVLTWVIFDIQQRSDKEKEINQRKSENEKIAKEKKSLNYKN